MPSRKQRRRREKSRRHEYEYVYVDEEGREVEVDAADLNDDAPKPRAGDGRQTRSSGGRRTEPVTRAGRRIEPPSWRRAVKRGLIFAPFMFLTLTLLAGELSVGARIFQTAYLLVMFVPFTYLMDRFMYRRFAKQQDTAVAAPSRRR